ncbi:MAG: oligoendopeptidase F [Bdellovibrionales bacterium]|nr:oligoendopeptidase F [Bdellovibrionales bacterium]
MKAFLIVTSMMFFLTHSVDVSAASSKAKESSETNWNLKGLFKSKSQWNRARKQVKKDLKPLRACKGKLGKSAQQLQSCLDKKFKTQLKVSEIYQWASLQKSTDSMSAKNTEMTGQAGDLYSEYGQAISFFAPELASLGKDKIEKFQKENKNLKTYSQYLRDVLVQSKHILSSKEEAVISAFRPVIGNASSTYGLLTSADIEWPKVKMSTGEATIDVAGYSKFRQSSNKSDREKAFNAFYGTLKKYERTFGSTLAQAVKSRTIEAKLRGYDNALSQALGSDNLPQKIYRTLVKEVNNSLPTLHRYLKLRKEMLGLKKQKYSDVYPAVVATKEKYSIDKTRKMTIDAVAPLGKDYVTRLTEATGKDWMDVYPRKGKRSGAFMSGGAYNLHPFVFLNHQDDYNSASTYAHEWGHAMHSIYSNKNQPYAKSDYSIFIAEIAAIVNEVLMIEKAVKDAKTDEEKLYYLGYALESIRGTYFRQTQFGEFELKLHEAIEKGEALSGQKISKIYGDIARRYFGHVKNVMFVDEKFFTEWAFVPQFYYGFYVYQYSTSISAAYYFAGKILKGDKDVLKKYQKLLTQGGAKYPHELLLDAGLDMSKADAYRAIDKKANLIMDEMEGILKKQGRIPKT